MGRRVFDVVVVVAVAGVADAVDAKFEIGCNAFPVAMSCALVFRVCQSVFGLAF